MIPIVTMPEGHYIRLDDVKAHIIPSEQRLLMEPLEYAKQLKRVLEANPQMSKQQFAERLGQTEQWLESKLEILKC